jgi:hypothetical protein
MLLVGVVDEGLRGAGPSTQSVEASEAENRAIPNIFDKVAWPVRPSNLRETGRNRPIDARIRAIQPRR